jgi:uncharacterized glyoxalase superfamily protein PhnB
MKTNALIVVSVSLLALAACGDSKSRNEAQPIENTGAERDRAFLWSAPILAVADLGETLRYYEEVLGFKDAWRWENGEEYGGIGRGGAWLSFDRNPEAAAHVHGQMVWFTVTGVDSLHAEHVAAGANIVVPLADQPWGFREYRVQDNNGYHLRIAEPIPCDDHTRCLKTSAR